MSAGCGDVERPRDGAGRDDAALRQEHSAFARDGHKVGEGSGRVGHVVTGDGAHPFFTVDEDDQAFDQGGDLRQLDRVAQYHGLAGAVVGSKAGPTDSAAVDEAGQDELERDAGLGHRIQNWKRRLIGQNVAA